VSRPPIDCTAEPAIVATATRRTRHVLVIAQQRRGAKGVFTVQRGAETVETDCETTVVTGPVNVE